MIERRQLSFNLLKCAFTIGTWHPKKEISTSNWSAFGKMRKTPVYLNDLPGVMQGKVGFAQRAKNTAAINAALSEGALLYFRQNTQISLASALFITVPGSGIVADKYGKRPVFFCPCFGRETIRGDNKYDQNAVVIHICGELSGQFKPLENILLSGFSIEGDNLDDKKSTIGIAVLNAKDVRISDIHIYNFPTGYGICLQSLSGEWYVEKCCVYNFFTDIAWSKEDGINPQMTGIALDTDIVGKKASVGGAICYNNIFCLKRGSHAIQAAIDGGIPGDQTDGINCGNWMTSGVKVIGNRISEVGEGIDWFGSKSVIKRNSIIDATTFGLKLTHGASCNIISENLVTRPGLAGYKLEGADEGEGSVTGNIIIDPVVTDVGQTRNTPVSYAKNDTACILIAATASAAFKPTNNTVRGGKLYPGTAGKYAWLDTSYGSNNTGIDIKARAGSAGLSAIINNGGAFNQSTGSTTDH